MLSLGLSGAGPAHCDFGAYAHLLPQSLMTEQLIRWTEFATFTPAMRTHTLPRSSPASFLSNRDALFQLSRLSKLRYHLAPYINHCIEDYLIDKIPPMRNMWEAYPNMDHSKDINDQYMLGQRAPGPRVKQDKTSRRSFSPSLRPGYTYSAATYMSPASGRSMRRSDPLPYSTKKAGATKQSSPLSPIKHYDSTLSRFLSVFMDMSNRPLDLYRAKRTVPLVPLVLPWSLVCFKPREPSPWLFPLAILRYMGMVHYVFFAITGVAPAK